MRMSPTMSALRSAMRRMLREGAKSAATTRTETQARQPLAGRPIGDRLAAAEAAMGEQIIELARALADQMRENLALFLALQIGAGRRRGQIELRCIARVLGHLVRPSFHFRIATSIARRAPSSKALSGPGAGCMDARSIEARAALLMMTVPSRMSCRSRRR